MWGLMNQGPTVNESNDSIRLTGSGESCLVILRDLVHIPKGTNSSSKERE
jgi:hypothetical protein